jgi:hypothetical protein
MHLFSHSSRTQYGIYKLKRFKIPKTVEATIVVVVKNTIDNFQEMV